MVTLNQLAEQVILDKTGQMPGKDTVWKMPDVVLKIKQVLGQLVRLDYYENIKVSGTHDVSFHYIQPVKVEIKNDSTTGQDYIEIPSVPLQIPGNKGVHELHPVKNPLDPFIITNSGQVGLWSQIIQDEIVCYPEHSRVKFVKCIRGKYKECILKIVCVTPESLGVDDEFFLPEDMQSRVVRLVFESMLDIPVDKVNDNNPSR